MEVNFQVKGLKELERFLVKELPAQVARRVLLSSLHQAGKPTVNLAKATAKGVKGGRSGALAASIGSISSRKGSTNHPQLNPKVAAAIAIGPLSGQGAKPLLAWSIYRSHYKRNRSINLKRGAPIGQIRHGHLVEFGFKHPSGKQIPGTHFLERAATTMGPTMARRFRKQTEIPTIRAIKRHNQRSPAGKR